MYQISFKYYPIRVIAISLLALHLEMLYDIANGEYGQIINWYAGVLLFHTPVWIAFIGIGEMLLRFISKINYNALLIILAFIIIMQLFANFQEIEFNFDFHAIYYLIVYLFNTLLLSSWEKIKNASTKND